MKILLIGPTALDFQGRPIKQRRLHLPGLTLPMLAAVTPEWASVRLLSETVEDIPYDEKWDLVGITGMGSGLVRAWQIADEFRRRGVPVVGGGIAASLCPPEWSLEHVDALVIGEAEEIWPQVVTDAAAGRLKNLYKAERRPPIDRLPLPRYDLMPRHKLGVWRPVQAARGCPFPCSFCSINAFFEHGYRKRPVEQVVRDVRAAKASGSRFIAFIDDNIGVDFKYSAQLWTALIPEKIVWMSQCSIHIADRPDMLELAARSGCRLLSFGIESVNESSLEWVEKGFNHPRQYAEAIRRIRRHNIDVSTEMIVGLDGDDRTVFQDTFDFIVGNRISVPRIHIMTPVPGTPMHAEMEAEGRIVSRDLGKYSGGQVVYRPKNFSAEELQNGYWRLYEKLFSVPNIFRRFAGVPGSVGTYMQAFILGVNWHYRGHISRKITPGIV